jgi:hypothetical protein
MAELPRSATAIMIFCIILISFSPPSEVSEMDLLKSLSPAASSADIACVNAGPKRWDRFSHPILNLAIRKASLLKAAYILN